MATTLEIENYGSINIKERTSLAVDAEIGATSLTLINNNNITTGDYVLVGRVGSETGEIRVIQSISGATLVTPTATTLRHNAYEDVTALVGNKINIYRAANSTGLQPADGEFFKIAVVSIDPDQLSTTYTDAIGGDGYWYKFTYYNETTTLETALSDSGAARGGGVGNYATLDEIRSFAGFERNRNITDATIDGFRRNAQDQVNGTLAGIYAIPFTSPVNGFINQITKTLAAGFLMLDEYGQLNEDGNEKVKWAQDQLKALRGGDLTLTDASGTILPKPDGNSGVPGGALGFSGYPNNSEQDGGFMFRRTDRY